MARFLQYRWCMETASGLIFGSVDIVMEYQYAFGPYLALMVMPEILFGTGYWGLGAGVGLNIYPMGKYLHGFFISLVPAGGVAGVGGKCICRIFHPG